MYFPYIYKHSINSNIKVLDLSGVKKTQEVTSRKISGCLFLLALLISLLRRKISKLATYKNIEVYWLLQYSLISIFPILHDIQQNYRDFTIFSIWEQRPYQSLCVSHNVRIRQLKAGSNACNITHCVLLDNEITPYIVNFKLVAR